MSAEIINLRRAKKGRERAARAKDADANRLAFGRSKVEKAETAAKRKQAERLIDGHRREPPKN